VEYQQYAECLPRGMLRCHRHYYQYQPDAVGLLLCALMSISSALFGFEKFFRISFRLQSRDLRFECIGSESDFRECIELCLVFSFSFFSNTSVPHVCRRRGKADKEERDLSFEM